MKNTSVKKRSIKSLMVARNALAKLSKEEVSELESQIYIDKKIRCVDAVHIDQSGNVRGTPA